MSAAEKYETPSISIGIEASAHSRSTIVGLISRSRPEIAVRQARLGAGRVRGHHVKDCLRHLGDDGDRVALDHKLGRPDGLAPTAREALRYRARSQLLRSGRIPSSKAKAP